MWVFAFAVAGYLLGSIPFAYLVGRAYGVDLRRQGTRNVGSSNVAYLVGRGPAAIAVIGDIGKGVAAVVLAWVFQSSPAGAAAAAVGAIGGHNWSLFLGLQGGRGVATTIGTMLALTPRAMGVGIIPFAVGALTHKLPIATIIGLSLVPLVAWLLGEPAPIVIAGLVSLAFMFIRRLTAIGVWETIRRAPDRRRVIINYLIWDNPEGPGYIPPNT
jgi:glycerol-3-phosphate acyltransferase PlsY